MMDTVDRAQLKIEQDLKQAIDGARGIIKPGKPGDCEFCGEWSSRLVGDACVPCREKYHLD